MDFKKFGCKPDRLKQREWLATTLDRIDTQSKLVAKFEPGSDEHRSAVQIMTLYQDCLHELTETDELLERLCRSKNKA